MEDIYPDSTLDVIEIDPAVTQIAYAMLGLRPDTAITSYNVDARMYMAQRPTAEYDLIMGDAFNDYSVPYDLTTQEFNDQIKAWLADGGLYMVNLIDVLAATSCARTSTPRNAVSRMSTSCRPCAPGVNRRGSRSCSSQPTSRRMSPPSTDRCRG